jgi:hypothetical protein
MSSCGVELVGRDRRRCELVELAAVAACGPVGSAVVLADERSTSKLGDRGRWDRLRWIAVAVC